MPPGQAQRRHLRRQGEALDLEAGGGRVADDALRLPAPAEEAGRLPRRLHVVIEPHHVRQPDGRVRRQLRARLEHLDDAAQVRPVGRADLPRLRALVTVARQQPVAAGVVQVAVGAERADDGDLVGDGGGARQQLAEVDARHGRLDRLEFAADFGGRVRLGVERLVLRRPALEPEEDDVLRLAEGARIFRIGARRQRPRLQQGREREAERAKATESQHLAAVEAVTQARRAVVKRKHDPPLLRSSYFVTHWTGWG